MKTHLLAGLAQLAGGVEAVGAVKVDHVDQRAEMMLGLDVETIISLVDLEVLHAAAGSHYRKTDGVRDESQQDTRPHFYCYGYFLFLLS